MKEQSTKSLPALVLEMAEIVSQICENNGELSPVLEQAMDCTAQELSIKADRYAFIMERLDAEAEYFKEKADQMSRVSKSCKALKDRLNENIKAAMRALNQDEMEGNEMRFRLTKLAPKLVIDEEQLPALFKMAVTEYVPDKERVKMMLSEGFRVDGAKLEDVYSLRKYPARKV